MLEALAAWTRLEALLAAAAEMDTLPTGHLARTVRLREVGPVGHRCMAGWAWLEGRDSGFGNKNPLRLGIGNVLRDRFECLSTKESGMMPLTLSLHNDKDPKIQPFHVITNQIQNCQPVNTNQCQCYEQHQRTSLVSIGSIGSIGYLYCLAFRTLNIAWILYCT